MSKELDKCQNNEAHLARQGKCIADLLHLKKDKDGRYNTAWGTRTDLGIYRSVSRILKEERINL